MSNLAVLSLLFGPSGIIAAGFATWKALQAERRAREADRHSARVEDQSVARSYLEAALKAQADNYNLLRQDVIDLRVENAELHRKVDELEDKLAFTEDDNRKLRRHVEDLERRLRLTEGGGE